MGNLNGPQAHVSGSIYAVEYCGHVVTKWCESAAGGIVTVAGTGHGCGFSGDAGYSILGVGESRRILTLDYRF